MQNPTLTESGLRFEKVMLVFNPKYHLIRAGYILVRNFQIVTSSGTSGPIHPY
jgi:hypothetical protein